MTQLTSYQPAVFAAAPIKATTRQRYEKAIANYQEATGRPLADAHALGSYAATLTISQQRHLSAAVTFWTKQQIQRLKTAVTPETTTETQAAVMRLEALQNVVMVKGVKGNKAHTWLTLLQQEKLLTAPKLKTVKGRRDHVALRLLLGCGLRREEATAARFDHMGNMGETAVLHVVGKGDKRRTIPLDGRFHKLLLVWQGEVGDGYILRSVAKGGAVGDSLSDVGLFKLVRAYGRKIGQGNLAPHDMRRTFAENLRVHQVDLPTISNLLGHESVETTMRYLNMEVDLSIKPSAFLPWVNP